VSKPSSSKTIASLDQVAASPLSVAQKIIAIIEGIEGAWIVNYPDGRTIGNIENQDDALHYVQRFGR
jgi:hypothetical protein